MSLEIYPDLETMGAAAAAFGAEKIRAAIAGKGLANIIVATGASQFAMLKNLANAPGIDWGKITLFHLDEYVGLSETHPASFRKYIKTRFVAKLPVALAAAYYVDGSNPDPQAVCNELGEILAKHPIDVCFIGIGENGHIAFNDPPADFDTAKAYLVVNLDEACRKQQFGEGWFPVFDDVPKQAISMSVRQIMKSRAIVNTVPDVRKAYAMQITFEGELSPMHPASVIRLHADAATFCDVSAASKLSAFTRSICAK